MSTTAEYSLLSFIHWWTPARVTIPSGAISVCLVGPASIVEYSLLPIITKKQVLITAHS